ncbi:hypothetical protein M0812_12669 [Anaeramoeba flamelloides]|uniref:Rap-GAP domain-containing protein n=1 Tax=Anaeramoeba flamelloides TaxID=1746091 RepID=A0AAV7ZLQ8_9EUKA|nr:hypothetical protein M0812_12669 [Anaeramoeba flamelloides]
MFLQHISEVTSNQHLQKTGTLITYPLDIKKSIIFHVLSVAKDVDNFDRILSSTFHIKWFLEFTGQAFSLPIDHHSIIEQAITIYQYWFSGEKIPKVFEAKKDYFLQQIFGHMSLIFQPREDTNKDNMKKHIELCKKVIQLYSLIQNKPKDYITEETWKHLLNIILGITDSLLQKGSQSVSVLSKELSGQILKLLFDLWLISEIKDIKMWNLLKSLAHCWSHRKETILQWCATIFGLSNRVLGILYGEFEGTITTTIALPVSDKMFQPSLIDLPNENVVFAWEKILYILENPNSITSPELFYLAMNGLSDVVDLLLNVGIRNEFKKAESSLILRDPPDGNSILKMFGKWIFEAVEKNRSSFEKGTAVAYKILCNIFCAHQKRPFLDDYINEFFMSIILAFENEIDFGSSIGAILQNTENIFTTNLEGLYILIPYYLKIINKILTNDQTTFTATISNEELRKSSIKIIKTLICLPNYFDPLEIPLIEGYSKDNVKNFKFITHLRTSIIKGFAHEISSKNAKIYLNLMISLLFETIQKQSTIIPLILLTIQKFICQPSKAQESFPTDVFLTAINALRSISCLIPLINKVSQQSLPNVVTGLSRVLMEYLQNPPSRIKQLEYDLVVCGMLNTICDFIVNSQWIFMFPNVLESVLKSIGSAFKEVGVEDFKNVKSKEQKVHISNKVNAEAHSVLLRIIRHCGNFPLTLGPSNMSSLITEEKLIEMSGMSKEEFSEHVRYFLLNDEQILTAVDVPIKEENEYVTYIIIRDISGRYSWQFKFRTLPMSYKPPLESEQYLHGWEGIPRPPLYPIKKNIPKTKKHELNVKYDFRPKFSNCLSVKDEISYSCLQHVLSVQHRMESVFRYIQDESSQWDISQPKIERVELTENDFKFNSSRLLLSNTGMMRVSDHSYLILLNQSEQFFEALKTLDECPERIQQTIGVVYVDEGQNRFYKGDVIFKNEKGDENFDQFLREIGWIVDLSIHSGYKGKLDAQKTGQFTPYYANYSNEIIFQVSTLMEKLKPEDRMNIIHKNYVVIVWCKDQRHFSAKSIEGGNNKVFIIIRPHYTGLFKIEIQDDYDLIRYSGPLMNGSLISRNLLGRLIRITAMNIHQEISMRKGTFVEPFENRRKFVNLIATSFSRKLSYDKFFSGWFTNETKIVNQK